MVQEKRVLSYWFKEEVAESSRAKMAQQFFKELVSPTQFPRGAYNIEINPHISVVIKSYF
jgi:hypothetical protein